MQLVQQLIRRGVLKPEDLARIAEVRAMTPSKPLHEILVERNFAKEEDVLTALVDALDLRTSVSSCASASPTTTRRPARKSR